MSLLEVSNVSKTFYSGRDLLGRRTKPSQAVSDVSLTLDKGECLAVVGESGAGKSTVGRIVLRLIEPDTGSIVFDGQDVRAARPGALRAMRRGMQMIFQDPHSCLDPRMSITDAVAEPLVVHSDLDRTAQSALVRETLEKVGIGTRYLNRYPAELSGGQLQRVAIARALVLSPKMIVCDEPVAALDVSVRAQVLNLLLDLREDLGLAYLFIGHDLALIEIIADRVIVMKSGSIVETGDVDTLFANPQEEYTRKLLAAIPVPIPKSARDAISRKQS